MDKSEYKICEVCGQEKHISEFSKSYPRRCKACVAEHTKMVRDRAKQEQKQSRKQAEERRGHEINFATKKDIDWEQRRYEVAKDMIAAFLSNSCSNVYMGNPDEQAKYAVMFADALIAELKKGGQDGQTAE